MTDVCDKVTANRINTALFSKVINKGENRTPVLRCDAYLQVQPLSTQGRSTYANLLLTHSSLGSHTRNDVGDLRNGQLPPADQPHGQASRTRPQHPAIGAEHDGGGWQHRK